MPLSGILAVAIIRIVQRCISEGQILTVGWSSYSITLSLRNGFGHIKPFNLWSWHLVCISILILRKLKHFLHLGSLLGWLRIRRECLILVTRVFTFKYWTVLTHGFFLHCWVLILVWWILLCWLFWLLLAHRWCEIDKFLWTIILKLISSEWNIWIIMSLLDILRIDQDAIVIRWLFLRWVMFLKLLQYSSWRYIFQWIAIRWLLLSMSVLVTNTSSKSFGSIEAVRLEVNWHCAAWRCLASFSVLDRRIRMVRLALFGCHVSYIGVVRWRLWSLR